MSDSLTEGELRVESRERSWFWSQRGGCSVRTAEYMRVGGVGLGEWDLHGEGETRGVRS